MVTPVGFNVRAWPAVVLPSIVPPKVISPASALMVVMPVVSMSTGVGGLTVNVLTLTV